MNVKLTRFIIDQIKSGVDLVFKKVDRVTMKKLLSDEGVQVFSDHLIAVYEDNCTVISDRDIIIDGDVFNFITLNSLDLSNTIAGKSLYNLFSHAKISRIKVGTFKTDKTVNMCFMFHDLKCDILDISTLNTIKVKDMCGMFSGIHIEELDVNNLIMDNVVDISKMFCNCSIGSLDLHNFNTKNVEDMSYMFFASDIKNLDLSSFNTENVTDMTSMFERSWIDNIDIGNFSDKSLKDCDRLFAHCHAKYINISGFQKELPQGVFRECCASIDYNYIDNTYTKVSHHIMNAISYLFDDCSGYNILFKRVKDLKKFTNRARSLGAEIYSINNDLYIVKIRENITIMSEKEFKLYGDRVFSHSKFKSLDIREIDTSESTSFKDLFDSSTCEVINISGIDSSKVEDMSGMFNECKYLRKIIGLESLRTDKVVTFRRMFACCRALEEIDLSSFNTSNCTNMAYMFSEIGIYGSLDISVFDTTKVQNMEGMFKYARINKLVENFNTPNLEIVQYMFMGVAISDLSLKNIDTSNVYNFSSMFSEVLCDKLDLTSLNMEKALDVDRMFKGCNVNLIIMNDLTMNNVKSFKGMFKESNIRELYFERCHCNNLEKLEEMFEQAVIGNLNIGLSSQRINDLSSMFRLAEIRYIDLSDIVISDKANVDGIFSECRSEVIYCLYRDIDLLLRNGNGILINTSREDYESEKECVHINRDIITKIDGDYRLSFNTVDNIEEIGIDRQEIGNDLYLVYMGNNEYSIISSKKIKLVNAGRFSGLFKNSRFTSIDLSNTYSDKLVSTSFMFSGCKAKEIILGNMDTSNVKSMNNMFEYCKLDRLDIRNLDTHNVSNMTSMFILAEIGELLISGIDTSNLENAFMMFRGLKTNSLDACINTDKVKIMKSMFMDAEIHGDLDIRTIKINRNTNVDEIFDGCRADNIIIGNIKNRKIFNRCKAKIIKCK